MTAAYRRDDWPAIEHIGNFYPIVPVPKPRMTQRDKWMKRPCVLRYRAFRDKCRLLRVELPEGCKVIFYLPMPKHWSRDEREFWLGKPHQFKPDLDNLIKGLWDAVFAKDEAIASVRAEKRWANLPGIEVVP